MKEINNNLPKEGWYIKNDGSQLFKDNIGNYLNKNYDKQFAINSINSFYGVNNLNITLCSSYSKDFSPNAKELTIQEFIELSKEKENKIILIEGEYYYSDTCIFIYVLPKKMNEYKCNNTCLFTTTKAFYNKNAAILNTNSNPERLATQQEKDWLNKCIKQNRFVELDQVDTKSKEELLLEEAKRRYPIGTKFYPNHIKHSNKSFCIITEDSLFKIEKNGNIYSNVNGTSYHWRGENVDYNITDKYGNTILNRCVYYNNQWAEIISIPEEKKSLYESFIYGNVPTKELDRSFYVEVKSNELYNPKKSNILDISIKPIKSISTNLVEKKKALLF